MDKDLMARALQTVLGEGYEARSHTTAVPSSSSPSPHDFLKGRKAPVAKSDPTGGDLHVPTTIGADTPKKRKGTLKPVEYVTGITKAMDQEKKEKLAHHLLTAGAIGGIASMPTLVRETSHKVGMLKDPAVLKGANDAIKTAKGVGKLKAIGKHPAAIAGLAGGAALLETAGLAGDFVGRSVTSQHKVKKNDDDGVITFSKVDDEKKQVFGWFSVSKNAAGEEVFDLQGDHIPIEETEKAAYDYMLNSRKGGNQHSRVYSIGEGGWKDDPKHVADIIESVVFTPEKIAAMALPETTPHGWWGGMQIHDEDTWAQIKRGERAGFSVHGKGRRAPVAEAVAKRDSPVKERYKDIALGTAGATAAGSGGTAALLPLAAKKGMISAQKAERLGGRFKTIGAVVGGTAGVYGGLHAVHNAAKELPVAYDAQGRVKPVQPTVAPKKRRIRKAWSPVVDSDTLEQRRGKRAKAYEGGAAAAGAGAAGVAAVHTRDAVRAGRLAKPWGQGMEDHVVEVHHQAALKRLSDKVAAKPNRRGTPQIVAAHRRSNKAAEATIKGLRTEHNARAGTNALRALGSAKKAGVAGAVALGAAGTAVAIDHKRKGSWKPYPGVR